MMIMYEVVLTITKGSNRAYFMKHRYILKYEKQSN